jgi:hypothetical protein
MNPVKAKKTPATQLKINPAEIFLLGINCLFMVLNLVNKIC